MCTTEATGHGVTRTGRPHVNGALSCSVAVGRRPSTVVPGRRVGEGVPVGRPQFDRGEGTEGRRAFPVRWLRRAGRQSKEGRLPLPLPSPPPSPRRCHAARSYGRRTCARSERIYAKRTCACGGCSARKEKDGKRRRPGKPVQGDPPIRRRRPDILTTHSRRRLPVTAATVMRRNHGVCAADAKMPQPPTSRRFES